MNLTAQFERMVNERGLVAMKFLHGFHAPYQEGAVAGFPPDRALILYADKEAVPVDANGVVLMEAPTGPVAPKTASPAVTSTSAVEIPENWESLHHLQRIRIAREIAGPDAVQTVEQATAIIGAEINRRTKA